MTEENTEVTVNDQIRDVMELAKKISPKHREEDGAQQLVAKLDSVVQKWNSIQDCINGYKVRLGRALVSHQLVSDMNDVIDIVHEKQKLLVLEEKSLQSPALVDKLIQKCVTIQDFLRSLEARVNKFGEQVSAEISTTLA